MGERWTPIVVMFAAVVVWWTRPVVAAVREWRRTQARARWDRRREWEAFIEAFEADR